LLCTTNYNLHPKIKLRPHSAPPPQVTPLPPPIIVHVPEVLELTEFREQCVERAAHFLGGELP
jgi:hypothetical protein